MDRMKSAWLIRSISDETNSIFEAMARLYVYELEGKEPLKK